jgi:chromosome segregation ATPase
MQAVRALLECEKQCKILKDKNESLRHENTELERINFSFCGCSELERSKKAEDTARLALNTTREQLKATRTQLDDLHLVNRDLQVALNSTESLNQKNQKRLLTQREQFKALEMQNAQVLQAKTDEHNRQAKTRDLWEKERADLCRKKSELEVELQHANAKVTKVTADSKILTTDMSKLKEWCSERDNTIEVLKKDVQLLKEQDESQRKLIRELRNKLQEYDRLFPPALYEAQRALLASFSSDAVEDDTKCCICFIRDTDTSVEPCKHKFCSRCAPAVSKECHLCRTVVVSHQAKT